MEEVKIETMQEVTEVQEPPYKSGSVQYIDSREVAEIVEKNHFDLMRDIRRYTKQLGESKIAFSDFFIESTYQSEQGKNLPCYLVTKKGCEFIAHKMTGVKGTKFTAMYINRFHEMEDVLESQTIPVLQKFMEQQAEINSMVIKKLEKMEAANNIKCKFRNPYMDEYDECAKNIFNTDHVVCDNRKHELNSLLEKVIDLTGFNKTRLMHNMYIRMQEVLKVSLDSYLNVLKSETGDNSLSTFDVVVMVDRFYDAAVDMNNFLIEKYSLYD